MEFKWRPDEAPPEIEGHSHAKLRVFRAYLRAYFDRLNVNPQREEFKLDLVDGFAGGGTFTHGEEVVSGTPLIMLEEADEARKRLNAGRRKPLRVNCKFYFVDKEAAHTDHLRTVLNHREYHVGDGNIVIRNSRFENEVDNILNSIHQRQPRSGRAIFLLDQTGFSQVRLSLISRIFEELPAAEIILTFAADALVNHLAQTPEIAKAVAPLQLTEAHINELIEHRDGDWGRWLAQRTLRDHARNATRATYDTPFFIRPAKSRRALWFLHLSRHPTARDVMIQKHWELQNTFEHYGPGGFGMLGWDALRDRKTLPLFQFRSLDLQQMRDQLLESLPKEIFGLASEQPVTIDSLRHLLANQTAARFSDLDEVIVRLVEEREFDILNPDGKVRSRSLTRLRATDRIALPSTLLLPGLSRRS